MQYTSHGAEWFVLTLVETTLAVKVPEQVISTVDKMDDHGMDGVVKIFFCEVTPAKIHW